MDKSLLFPVNVEKYPIHDFECEQFRREVFNLRDTFAKTGLCVLDEFLLPDVLEQVIEEARELAPLAFHAEVRGNAYLDELDENLPDGHARRMTDTTRLGAVAFDQIPAQHLIRKVYLQNEVTRLIEEIVNRGHVYRYACPLGAMNIAVMNGGEHLRWHFDQSDFVVSIPLQEAEDGGEFEFVHDIRSAENENYDGVKELLLGERTGVQVLEASPGSLVLFQGRNTIHRVTSVRGSQPRLGALLGYSDRPDVVSSEYLKKIRYGRTK